MKKPGIFILLVFFSLLANAQQIGMYSHAFFKPLVYNPAFTGIDDATNAMLISHSQWTGFKGAPQLNLFTLDGNIRDKKVGLGLQLISDRKGVSNRVGGNLSYSYRLNITDDMQLRFGIAAGIIDQTIDYSKALVENGSDPTLFTTREQKTAFDANAGLALIFKQLEFGVAAPQLLGNRINYVDNSTTRARYTQSRHYIGTLKYNFLIAKDKGIALSPMALVRLVPNTPLQYEGTLNLEWKEKFRIGATYKSDYALTVHAGVCLYKQLSIGYAYDIILGSLSKYAGVSHELMINFKFGKNKKENTPLENPEASAKNELLEKKIDSLQEEVSINQAKLSENHKRVQELSDQLNQLSLQKAQTPAASNNTDNNPTATNPQTPGHTNEAGQNANQNFSAVATNQNKTLIDNLWVVSNKTSEFKDDKNHAPQKGFYVVAGTFVYRDFAEAEAKRFVNEGFSGANVLFYQPRQFNYVFISKCASKEEAIKKANEIKLKGIKDAWVLDLNE